MKKRFYDFIMLRDGSSINGLVEVKVFSIKLNWNGTLPVKKQDILAIHYKNPPKFLWDLTEISTGSSLAGDVLPIKIPVRPEGWSQTIQIDKKDIHSLVFFIGDTKSLSRATKKLLLSIK